MILEENSVLLIHNLLESHSGFQNHSRDHRTLTSATENQSGESREIERWELTYH